MATTSHKVGPAIAVRTLRPQPYIGIEIKATLASVDTAVAAALHRLRDHARSAGLQVEGDAFILARDCDGPEVDSVVGLPVAAAPSAEGEIHPGRLPGGRAVIAIYQGPAERMSPCYEELRDWIAIHGLEPCGPPREVYLNGHTDVTSEEQLLTELVWPVH